MQNRPRVCTCRCLNNANVLRVTVKDFRVKMWIGDSIPYFTVKHQVEGRVFAEFIHCHRTVEHLRTTSVEPIPVSNIDDEMLALKKQHSALVSKKWTDLDTKRNLLQLLQTRLQPSKQEDLDASILPRSFQVTPKPKPLKPTSKPKKLTNQRYANIRSSMSPRKPPANFYALPDAALKAKYNMPWERKKTVRRLESTADNSFVVRRTVTTPYNLY